MNISWGEFGSTLIRQASEKRVPIQGQFELTARCNLKCKMCYLNRAVNDIDAIKRERSAQEWIRLAAEARDAGMLYLLLTGGKVFLRQDFREIYEAISMMGFNVMIYTNATMITKEIADWLGHIPPSKVEVSMYGSSPEVYLNVCGSSEAYTRAVQGIDLLLSRGITVGLRTTVIRGNADEYEKIAEFAQKRNMDFGVVNYISPRREAGKTLPEGERLSPEELAEYEMRVQNYLNKGKLKASDNTVKIDKPSTDNKEHPFYCTSGKCSFWITWDGRMTPCGLMNGPASFPFENGFNNAWKELQESCCSLPICTECTECVLQDYCMSCIARLWSETGCYDKPAPYLCRHAQSRKAIEELRR